MAVAITYTTLLSSPTCLLRSTVEYSRWDICDHGSTRLARSRWMLAVLASAKLKIKMKSMARPKSSSNERRRRSPETKLHANSKRRSAAQLCLSGSNRKPNTEIARARMLRRAECRPRRRSEWITTSTRSSRKSVVERSSSLWRELAVTNSL